MNETKCTTFSKCISCGSWISYSSDDKSFTDVTLARKICIYCKEHIEIQLGESKDCFHSEDKIKTESLELIERQINYLYKKLSRLKNDLAKTDSTTEER